MLTAWVQSNGTARGRLSFESWANGRVLAGDSATVAITGPGTWVKQTLRVRVDTGAFAAVIKLGS